MSTRRKRGGQPGNRNAAGHGAPLGNKNAFKHGLYERFPPLYKSENHYRAQAEERRNRKRVQFWEDVYQIIEPDSLNGFVGDIFVDVSVYPDGSRVTERVQCAGYFPEGRGLVRRQR